MSCGGLSLARCSDSSARVSAVVFQSVDLLAVAQARFDLICQFSQGLCDGVPSFNLAGMTRVEPSSVSAVKMCNFVADGYEAAGEAVARAKQA